MKNFIAAAILALGGLTISSVFAHGNLTSRSYVSVKQETGSVELQLTENTPFRPR